VYVFDDADPDETSYLGIATIPLIPLGHDKSIQGTFELITVNNLALAGYVYCVKTVWVTVNFFLIYIVGMCYCSISLMAISQLYKNLTNVKFSKKL